MNWTPIRGPSTFCTMVSSQPNSSIFEPNSLTDADGLIAGQLDLGTGGRDIVYDAINGANSDDRQGLDVGPPAPLAMSAAVIRYPILKLSTFTFISSTTPVTRYFPPHPMAMA